METVVDIPCVVRFLLSDSLDGGEQPPFVSAQPLHGIVCSLRKGM